MASMLREPVVLRTQKKTIARLPELSKCVEAIFLSSPSPKGETPHKGGGDYKVFDTSLLLLIQRYRD
jgi:hypothetical protein